MMISSQGYTIRDVKIIEILKIMNIISLIKTGGSIPREEVSTLLKFPSVRKSYISLKTTLKLHKDLIAVLDLWQRLKDK